MEEKIKELKEKFEGSNKYMLTLSYEDIKELFAIIEVLKNNDQYKIEKLKSIKDYEPQKISYELLNYARHTDLVSKDDMSVIALKIKLI
jgi:hypothetical protein